MTHLARIGGAAALAAAVWAPGRAALYRLLPEMGQDGDPWERLAFSFGLGYAIWSLGVLFLGLAGAMYGPLLCAGIAAGVLSAGLTLYKGRAAAIHSPLRALTPAWKRPEIAFPLLFLIWLIATQLPYALAPETFYDALVYHLALPAHYLKTHRITALPHNLFAGVPAAPQMLFAAALALESGGAVAKLFHFGMIFWTAAALRGAAGRLGRPEAGALAAAAFASAPLMLYEITWTTVGIETAFFRLICLSSLAAAGQAPAASRRRLMILTGIFCGCAMACKYTDWLLPGTILLVLLSRRWHGQCRDLIARDLIAAALAALVVAGPWALKNTVHYGNPVHPFAAAFFAPETASRIDVASLVADTAAPDLRSAPGLLKYLRHPWDMAVRSGSVDMDAAGPLWLCIAAVLVLFPLTGPARFAALFFLFSWIPISFFALQARYFIPASAVLCLAVSLQIWSLPGLTRSLLAAWTLLAAAYSATFLLTHRTRGIVVPTVVGKASESRFLAHGNGNYYPNPPFAAFQYIRDYTPPGAKVLLFGDARSFYLDRDALSATVFDVSPLVLWANAAADREALKVRLRTAGITHVVINRAEMLRLKRAPKFTEKGEMNFREFWKRYALKEFEVGATNDRWVLVFRLLSDAEAAQPHETYDPLRAPSFTPGTEPKNIWTPPPGLLRNPREDI